MRSQEGAGAGLLSVEEAIDAALNVEPSPRAVISGIGIVCPGPLDPRLGIVVNPVNLPCWRNFSLVAQIQKSRGLPTTMDNDADAAALAESIWGAGAGYSSVFYVTIGTGIGTGLVLDGHVYPVERELRPKAATFRSTIKGRSAPAEKKAASKRWRAGPAVARRARAMLAAASTRFKAARVGRRKSERCDIRIGR